MSRAVEPLRRDDLRGTSRQDESIVIEASGDEEVRVIAKWLGVVGG